MTTNAQPYGMLTDPRYMDLLAAQQQEAPPPLQKVMQSAPPPMSGHLVHTLNTADAMGGPVAPDPATIAAAMPPQPKVTQDQDPLHQREGHLTNELNRDYEKDANPWGSPNNHPGIGGKIAHVLSKVGNIAGGILAPSVMANIPGTDLNRRAEEQGLAHQIQEVTGEESRNAAQDATTAHTNAETPEVAPNAESSRALQGAQESNLESETSSRDNPKPSYEIHDTAAGPLFVNKATGTAQHLSVDGTPIGPKIQTKAVQLEIGGKPHQVLVNEADGSLIKDLGETGEKPPTVRVETAGEQRGAKNDILKAYQPTLDSGERMNVMTENYEKAIKDHDQQAMLSLLANHLGMTMGLQKGARLTKDIIHEAQQSQPWLQGLAAKFDKDGYLAGVTLSPNQMRQMVGLGQSRYAEDAKKSRATAGYLGAKDDGPDRIPGAATINYYKSLAGGNGAKAKELATADGWTVR